MVASFVYLKDVRQYVLTSGMILLIQRKCIKWIKEAHCCVFKIGTFFQIDKIDKLTIARLQQTH